jgi:hypothetical protein
MYPLFRGQSCGGCILIMNADVTPSPQSRLPKGKPSRDGLFRALERPGGMLERHQGPPVAPDFEQIMG